MAIDFYRAAREGHSDTLRVITKRDANKASEDGMTPVHWAASYGNLEALRILMRKGYDVTVSYLISHTCRYCGTG